MCACSAGCVHPCSSPHAFSTFVQALFYFLPFARLPAVNLRAPYPPLQRFAICPEAFQPEGWLPEPPGSYEEALRRQQRLLHGAERRRCLHLHKVCVCVWGGCWEMTGCSLAHTACSSYVNGLQQLQQDRGSAVCVVSCNRLVTPLEFQAPCSICSRFSSQLKSAKQLLETWPHPYKDKHQCR